MIKEKFRELVGIRLYNAVKRLYLSIIAIPYGNNLSILARIYKSDKWGKHFYTSHYSTYFRKFKYRRIKLFEIGVGGYHYPNTGGNSLRMWKRYFPFGKIYSLDIYDKSFVEERRIRIFQGDQTDEMILNKIMDQINDPDIIIDDGSHINEHVIRTFKILFPRLKNGGIYVVEDVQTSYWPDYGGDSEDLKKPSTVMNFFKSLTDCLNHQELLKPGYVPTYFDKNIVSINFYL